MVRHVTLPDHEQLLCLGREERKKAVIRGIIELRGNIRNSMLVLRRCVDDVTAEYERCTVSALRVNDDTEDVGYLMSIEASLSGLDQIVLVRTPCVVPNNFAYKVLRKRLAPRTMLCIVLIFTAF
jgi:hypothetical protein